MKTWINGRRSSALDVSDRGLHYGDGLFETMCVRHGSVRLLEFHLHRLAAGLRRLKFPVHPVEVVKREIERAASGVDAAVLKLLVTRGPGSRGYRPDGTEQPTRVLMLSEGPAPTADGPSRVRICDTRLGSNPALAGLKTLNRLESVLARNEWRDARVWEGLMLDTEDHVVCGTMSNLFLRHRGTLYTPHLDRCGVAGVMQRFILAECRVLRIAVRFERLGWNELARAEEVFMSNALVGIRSVRAVEWRSMRRRARYEEFALAERLRRRLEAI